MQKILKHPKIVIAIALVLTVFFALQLKGLEIDNTLRSFMPKKNESYIRLLDSEDEFGSMVVAGVSLETDGKTILTADNIRIIDNITKRVEKLDQVKSVQSLTNIDYVESVDGALVAGSLLGDDYKGTEEDIARVEKKIADWDDLYDRVIVSDDRKATQLMVTIQGGTASKDQEALLAKLRVIINEEIKGSGLSLRVYGDPVLNEQAKSFMMSDLESLIPLVIVVVLLSLLISFGTADGTLLPLASVLMATVWTIGIISLRGETFNIIYSVVPVALIAVGSAYGIHVMTHYYVALDNNMTFPMTRDLHGKLIMDGLRDVRDAILLAAFTTIAGFLSLVSSPIQPLHGFAIYTALGVTFSLILSVTFIPAVLMCKKPENVGKKSKRYQKRVEKVEEKLNKRKNGSSVMVSSQGNGLYMIYRGLAGTKTRMLVFMIILTVCSVFGIRRMVVDTSMVNYFPANSDFRKDIDFVDKEFAGTNSIYFTVESTGNKDITNPEVLKAIDDLDKHLLSSNKDIGKIVSFPTFLKRMNQVMHIPTVEETETDLSSMGDEGDSDETLSSFGDGSLSSFGGDEEEEPSAESEYVDPNIAYGEQLGKATTTNKMMDMLNEACVAAGKDASVGDVVDELEKKLNYNGKAYYEVPYDPDKYPAATREELSDLVSQYLLLFSGSLDQFNNDPLAPTKTRVQVQLRSHDTAGTQKVIDEAKAYAAKHFPEGYDFQVTGSGEMECAMSDLVIKSQMESLALSLAMVIVILSVAFHSVKAGLLGGVPLLFTILLSFMTMGFTGIHLDLVTSIIASVAVGVGIDYTIHFMETYRNERAKSDDIEAVTRETFRKSGHGIVTNAVAVGLGFLVLCLSKFSVLQSIGVLAAAVMLFSSVLAMTVIPGILCNFDPKMAKGKLKSVKTK